MREFRAASLLVACLVLSSCVTEPRSRTTAESSSAVTLSGYAASGGATITIQAVDQNTGNLVTLGTAPSSMSGMPFTTSGGTHYTVYPWSYPAGVLASKYWSPQTIVPDLATNQGHLEITASSGPSPFRTFSQDAFDASIGAGL